VLATIGVTVKDILDFGRRPGALDHGIDLAGLGWLCAISSGGVPGRPAL